MVRVRVTEIDNPRQLGRRLKEKRAERGLTLRELSFPGCTAPYISSIEHGRRVPSLQILSQLADRLGVSVEFLGTGRAVRIAAQIADAELALRLGDADEARSLFEAIQEPADAALRQRRLGGLGVIAVQEGRLDEGIKLLEEAREIDPRQFAALTSLVEALGRSYANRADYPSAIELFTTAKERAVEQGDGSAVLRLTGLLANTFIDLGDLGSSAQALADALVHLDDLRDPRLRANVYWTQARLHTVEGRQDLAADFAERAIESLRFLEDERAFAFAQQTLAYIELERGEPLRALELLEQAAPIINRAATATEQAVFELERARALAAVGRLDEAKDALQKIGPVLRDGPKGDGGRYSLSLASLYEQLDFHEDALQMYDAAIAALDDHRNPHLVRAHRLKSELLDRLGRKDEAYDALREAVRAQDTIDQRH